MSNKSKQQELREKQLSEFTHAVDHERWSDVLKLYEQIEKIIDSNSTTMKLIKMDIDSMPEEFKQKEGK